MAINILFTDVGRSDDPKQYIRDKLSAAYGQMPEADLDQLVDLAYREGQSLELPMAAEEDFPPLTDQQQRSVGRKTRLFVAAVDRMSPLLHDETKTEDDFATYLSEDFRGYAKNTPVLVRQTNRASISYVFENVTVDTQTADVSYEAAQSVVRAGAPDAEQHIRAWMAANIPRAAAPKPEKILGDLTKALVGMLPGAYGKIGATILGIIIPSGGGIDYDQLLDDISTIIADAIRRQTISEQGGILNGVVGYINGNYIPQRDAGRSSKEVLFNLLNPQLAEVYKTIGVLKQEEFKKGGVSTFISAVTHKYLIFQEMAVQDPGVTDPKDSSKATSIRHDVGEDSTHVEMVVAALQSEFDRYLDDWIRQISGVLIRITDCPKNEYYFHDSKTNYRSPYFEQHGCKDDPHARCEQARNEYIAKVKREYRQEHQDQLPWMREAASNWKKLLDTPIPSQ